MHIGKSSPGPKKIPVDLDEMNAMGQDPQKDLEANYLDELYRQFPGSKADDDADDAEGVNPDHEILRKMIREELTAALSGQEKKPVRGGGASPGIGSEAKPKV